MKVLRWFIVFCLVIGLVLVRKFETVLFYDPLLEYFHKDFMHLSFPTLDNFKHFISVGGRYFINSCLSLAIIWFIFRDKKAVKFSALVFSFFFVILILLYYYFISIEFKGLYTAGFYVRRMLIQPVMLLILIPGIWYWKNYKKDAV